MFFIGWSGFVSGPDKDEKTAIEAIRTGDLEVLKSYLEKHPDLNCTFSNGKTGLYYAIMYDKTNISMYLLGRGADPDYEVSGNSTMYWAIKYDRGRIVRLLIEYGADLNKPDARLKTPLIYAAEFDNMEMCKILVNRGAEVIPNNLKEKRASDYLLYNMASPAYLYLMSMEKIYKSQDTVPSMHDGPYIYWEDDSRIILTYYEHNQDKSLTRIIEKTLDIRKTDTIVKGFGWDTNSYYIRHSYAPDPCKIETNAGIFAIGDIHGRYHAVVNLLINNKVIDSDLNWTFGKGQLVLLGDVFDRGSLVTETLWFLYELDFKAKKSGGNVHLLLGNHEVMEMTGDDRYLNPKYRYFMDYTQGYYFQLYERNTVLGRWLRSQNVIIRVNDDLFMHAGISPQFAVYDFSYTDINSTVRQYLNSDNSIRKGSPDDLILGAIGPQWYRGYVSMNGSGPQVTQQFIDDYLSSKGLKRMILGHNEQLTIRPAFEGKIIFVDVEIDESGKSAEGLLISGDEYFRCLSDGTKGRIE